MSLRSDILGAVMAGGKSSRMGAEKALLPLGGRPMISHVIDTLSELFSAVIICGADPATYEFLRVRIVQDIFQGCGPLGGIHSALTHSKPRSVFVLSCDMPFVPLELIRHIINSPDKPKTKIASSEGILQPLCGLYRQECLPFVEADLRAGKYSIVKMLQNVDHSEVVIDSNLPFYTKYLLNNVNRSEDYEAISKKIREYDDQNPPSQGTKSS
jgi:molybdopterin-guanine dinucleotide biosynthesis protein A